MIYNTKPITIDINGIKHNCSIEVDNQAIRGLSSPIVFKRGRITKGVSCPDVIKKMWLGRNLNSRCFKAPVYNILSNGKYIFNIDYELNSIELYKLNNYAQKVCI